VQVTHIEIPTDDQEGREPGVGAKYRLSWKGVEFPSWTLRAERVMEVEVLERGEDGRERCEVRTWETMAGPLAGVVKMAVGAGLDGAFARFAADMKAWVEGGMGEGKDGADGEAED
jgi:hypothetical protein